VSEAALQLVLTDEELFEDARTAERQADEDESENRWRAADDYAELQARGYSTRQIGERVGKSHTHVRWCISAAGKQLSTRGAFADAYREAQGGAHVSNNSGDNEWYTPPEYIEAAIAVMGVVDLDPASSIEANLIVGAEKFYSAEEDGLEQDWQGRIWMNPPYARPLIDGFCGKLAETFAAGDVTEACVLVNNGTETGWFHALAEVASAICFPRHRVKFWHPEKESVPLQGQAVIYLGPNVDRFRSEFIHFGFTVTL
jgi:phage N-6-adenine-methyltransferase